MEPFYLSNKWVYVMEMNTLDAIDILNEAIYNVIDDDQPGNIDSALAYNILLRALEKFYYEAITTEANNA